MPASTRISVSIATAALLTSGLVATNSVAQTAGCAGELTVRNFDAAECIGRIAIPTPRPDPTATASLKQDRVAVVPVYIETPAEDGHGTRRVRLVGTRFLPDDNAKYDLRRPVTFASDPVNAAVFGIASLFMPDAPRKDATPTVAQTTDSEKPVLEARANLAARMAAN